MDKDWGSVPLNPLVPARTLTKLASHVQLWMSIKLFFFFQFFFHISKEWCCHWHTREGSWSAGGLGGRELKRCISALPLCSASCPGKTEVKSCGHCVLQLAIKLWDTTGKIHTGRTSFRVSLSYIWNWKEPLLRNRGVQGYLWSPA